MAEMVNGREADTDVIVSTGPDVCLTPVGPTMVPVAYTSVAFLGRSERLPSTVLDNEHPDFHLNSRVCTSTGHEPGVGAGVVVPGYQGEAFVQEASPTVFSEGWATTRHRDPAFINRPGGGATEPFMPRTDYHAMCVARVEARPIEGDDDEVFESDLEADLPSRELEPGTNESVETANGTAMLVTDAEAPPEEDWRRRPGESREEYFERLNEHLRSRRGRGEEGMLQRAQELEDIQDAIESDPDFYAWRQNLPADVYHDPLGTPGIEHNEVLSSDWNRSVESAMGVAQGSMYSFAGPDGQVYSGDANSIPTESSGVNALLYAIDQQRGSLLPPNPEEYGLSEAVRDIRTMQDIRERTRAARRMGTLIRGGTVKPDGPSFPMPNILDMF